MWSIFLLPGCPWRTVSRAKAVSYTHLEHVNRLVVIDQSPIGKTPRATPATATGLLQELRPLDAQLPRSKQRGYTAARFSPNIRGGRCERCQGTGMIEVDMNFLGNVAMPLSLIHI